SRVLRVRSGGTTADAFYGVESADEPANPGFESFHGHRWPDLLCQQEFGRLWATGLPAGLGTRATVGLLRSGSRQKRPLRMDWHLSRGAHRPLASTER